MIYLTDELVYSLLIMYPFNKTTKYVSPMKVYKPIKFVPFVFGVCTLKNAPLYKFVLSSLVIADLQLHCRYTAMICLPCCLKLAQVIVGDDCVMLLTVTAKSLVYIKSVHLVAGRLCTKFKLTVIYDNGPDVSSSSLPTEIPVTSSGSL